MQPGAGAKTEQSASWTNRLMWVVLVGIVPFLVLVFVVGIALQIIGVPVWSTVTSMLGLGPKKAASLNPVTIVRQQLAEEKLRNVSLGQQITALSTELSDEKAKEAKLQAQIKQLESQSAHQAAALERAKREATLLAGMDAGQAAQVLSRMTLQEGALVISQMQPANASDILAAVNPTLASRLIHLAAQLTAEQSQNSRSSDGSNPNG
jgi:flagellar motility protein MotE (MotC chaperone)